MNEAAVLVEVLDEVRAALPGISVSTEQGEQTISVPGVVLSDPMHQPHSTYNGHQSYAGTTVNGSGVETGTEHHFYFWFSATIVARSEDEEQVDDMLDSVFDHFAPHADDPRSLHADFSQLNIGQAFRRVDAIREPDWFESGRELRILYVKRVTQAADALSSVDQVVDGDAF
jgi:hypothetical protein